MYRNGCIIHEEKSLKKFFNHEMFIANHRLVFTQTADTFELRVDNESFMFIYNQLKQGDHFKYEKDEPSHQTGSSEPIQSSINTQSQ